MRARLFVFQRVTKKISGTAYLSGGNMVNYLFSDAGLQT